MSRSRPKISPGLFCLALIWPGALSALASSYQGQVVFNGLPVPGATVTLTRGNQQATTTTDAQGVYSFSDIADGPWSIQVEMTGFTTLKENVSIVPGTPPAKWELQLLPLGQIKARLQVPNEQAPTESIAPQLPAATQPKPSQSATTPSPASEEDLQRAEDGLLINGSVNNGAASPFGQLAAFGNMRKAINGLYNGGIGFTFDNSALDARPFSLTGQNTPQPAYNRMTGLLALGGPLRIPHVLPNGPNFFLAYQWTRNRNATTDSALVPDAAERDGNFSQTLSPAGRPIQITDPATGSPFPGGIIPASRFSPQALALLHFYPLPDFSSSSGYNYQIPLITPTHQDSLQSRLNKSLDIKNQLYGRFDLQSIRTDNPSLFQFLDTTDTLGLNTGVNWLHRFNQRVFLNLGYQFSRFSTRTTPYFENRANVSALSGISGNNQNPLNWGPPSLIFSSGITELTDAESADNHNQTGGVSASLLWNHRAHNFTLGGDFRRQQFNYLSQQNPRGSFTFTGAATGVDFADFLLGIPDTSSIAYGNADKYFRESAYDAFFNDDWRVGPQLTINAGIRWEYAAPITELYGRLVNLDIAPGFSAVAPIVASDSTGALTGQHYPSSLLAPDKSAFEPRVGVAWRPLSGSSLVVRAGYGVYYDTSVYQTIAVQMAQQAPLSKSLSVQNSAADPLTLANGFVASPTITPDTFAVNPDFRIGYAQNWQLAIQHDLPGAVQLTATYLGIKGTRGVQEFLPNTVPLGAVNPCPACPTGFAYLTSGGNSTREAAQLQLRRRLHNGLTGLLQYTFSKSIDDDASLGGQGASIPQNSPSQNSFAPSFGGSSPSGGSGQPSASSQSSLAIAQNWLNLAAERSLSSFDQRHLLSFQLQYTSGMGLGGGSLLSGWKGALLKEWTFAMQVTAGTGLPETPVYLAPVEGTGVTGTIRPDYTGAPLYAAPAGLSINPAAFVAPTPGQWGTAGRNSITGPAEFILNASLGRTFRLSDRFNLDLRVDSTNPLNHVTYTEWVTTINSAQFGLPAAANPMRSLQTTLRLRF